MDSMQTALAAPPATPDLAKVRRFLREGTPGPHWYAALLGLDDYEFRELRARVEKGFSYRTLERLQRNLDLPLTDLAELVLISPRTLARRKQEGKLLPEESDRLLRISRVFGRTLELFEGDAEGSLQWLASPQTALGGAVPLEVARTELGAREIEALIGRLDAGVYS